MPKSDLVQLEGEIVQICPNGLYKVSLDSNQAEISAKLCVKCAVIIFR